MIYIIFSIMTPRRPFVPAAALALLASAATARAQFRSPHATPRGTSSSAPRGSRRRSRSTASWTRRRIAQVEALTDFIQSEPQQGAPSSERTEAWVLFDDDNLYLACRCWDRAPRADGRQRDAPRQPEPAQQRQLRRRARHVPRPAQRLPVQHHAARRVLRRAHTRRAHLQLRLEHRVAGARSDGSTADGSRRSRFRSSRCAIRPGRDQTWGINIRRTIRAKNEWTYIVPMRPDWGPGAIFRMSAAATLAGLEVPPAGQEPRDQAVRDLTPDDRPRRDAEGEQPVRTATPGST